MDHPMCEVFSPGCPSADMVRGRIVVRIDIYIFVGLLWPHHYKIPARGTSLCDYLHLYKASIATGHNTESPALVPVKAPSTEN